MKLSTVADIIWRWYQNGKAQANNQKLLEQDILNKAKLLYSDLMRQRYYESKKLDEFGRPDYSFSSPLFSIKRFELSEADNRGKRRIDMPGINMYRLPNNSHITNLYTIGTCKDDEVGEITQVNPGEENFYVNDPDLKDFMFCVPRGQGIDTYNIPLCVKSIDVEATFDTEDLDIDMSTANVVADQILNVSLGIQKQYYSQQVQEEMRKQNIIQ